MNIFQKFSDFCRKYGKHSTENSVFLLHCYNVSISYTEELANIFREVGFDIQKQKENQVGFSFSLDFSSSQRISIEHLKDSMTFVCKFTKSETEIRELNKLNCVETEESGFSFWR